MDCYVSIQYAVKIILLWIVTLLSHMLFGFSFDRLFHQFLAQLQLSLLIDCYLRISHAVSFFFLIDSYFSIPYCKDSFSWIITVVSCALLGFSLDDCCYLDCSFVFSKDKATSVRTLFDCSVCFSLIVSLLFGQIIIQQPV